MIASNEFLISWLAPVVPSVSLAGIPLHVDVDSLERVLSGCLVEKGGELYQFHHSPLLRLSFFELDEDGNGGYCFDLSDKSIINPLMKFTPALSIMIKGGRVYAVKVYDFSFSGDVAQDFIYKGRGPNEIGLGSLVSDLLPHTSLEFDSAEGWFYTDLNYGGLEVTGWGVPLEEHFDQVITALCVISGAMEVD